MHHTFTIDAREGIGDAIVAAVRSTRKTAGGATPALMKVNALIADSPGFEIHIFALVAAEDEILLELHGHRGYGDAVTRYKAIVSDEIDVGTARLVYRAAKAIDAALTAVEKLYHHISILSPRDRAWIHFVNHKRVIIETPRLKLHATIEDATRYITWLITGRGLYLYKVSVEVKPPLTALENQIIRLLERVEWFNTSTDKLIVTLCSLADEKCIDAIYENL